MTTDAAEFIRHKRSFVEREGRSLSAYQFWIDSESELSSSFQEGLAQAARLLLSDGDELVAISAIQALAWVGSRDDVQFLRRTAAPSLAKDAECAIELIEYRAKSIEQLLDEVRDQRTFVLFGRALASERKKAARIERANPQTYVVDGALGWKNADIPGFIFAALVYFERENKGDPTWQDLARFLYMGKIYE